MSVAQFPPSPDDGVTEVSSPDPTAAPPPSPKLPFDRWIGRFDCPSRRMQRLLNVADGVFAFSLTLLALEVQPARDWNGDLGTLFGHVGGTLAAYATAFLLLAGIWAQHRRMMALLCRIDAWVEACVFAKLALVALLPTVVRLHVERAELPTTFVLYGGALTAIYLIFLCMWGHAALRKGLVAPDLPRGYRVWHAVMLAASCVGIVLAIVLLRLLEVDPSPTLLSGVFAAAVIGTFGLSSVAYRKSRAPMAL